MADILRQRNKRTGEIRVSTDGGLTWTSQGVQTRGPDPLLPSRITKAHNDAVASNAAPATAQAELRIKQLEAQIKAIEAANAGENNALKLQESQLAVQKLQAELETLKAGKGGAMKALQDQVDRVNTLYQQNIQGGVVPNRVNDIVPDSFQPGKGQFDTAGQGLTNPFMAAFRIPGSGSQSDTELLQFIRANVPQQGDSDSVIEEKLRNIQTRIDAEKPPAPPQTPQTDISNPQMTQSDGKTESRIDPGLRATAQRVGRMISNGVPDQQIRQFLQKSGADPKSTNIEQILQYRRTPDFKTWQRANPGRAYDVGPSFYTKEIPLTGGRAMFNKTASTDLGGAAAAGAVASANAISGGRLDDAVGALSGDPQMAETGMELLRTQHPAPSFVGDLAGQASAEAAMGLIPGARGLMATRWGRRGADALYGAYSGSGEDNENPLAGAFKGAAANAGFGMLGRGTQRGFGRAMTGVRNANLGYLDRAGVPLTIGQIARGSDNVLGNFVAGTEERAAGLPGMDAVIGAARQRGDRGFNRAAFREMAGHSGETGAKGLDVGGDLVNGAYSFLDPIVMPLDAQYAGTNAGIVASLPDLPKHGPEIGATIKALDKTAKGGSLTGRDWRENLSAVRGDRSTLAGEKFSTKAIATLKDLEGNLEGLAARQAPPEVAGNLAAANKLNAQQKTLEAALDNGPTQRRGELFSASRLDDVSRVNARNYGGRLASLTGNRPFYDLTQAGMDVMPNLTPDSGTAGRILLVPAATTAAGSLAGLLGGDDKVKGAASGGGYGLAGGLSLAALAAAPYSKTGQKALQRALLGPRNRQITRLGDFLINNPRVGGLLGSALGRDLFLQPELPPQ